MKKKLGNEFAVKIQNFVFVLWLLQLAMCHPAYGILLIAF
jgi:hypothetical protein